MSRYNRRWIGLGLVLVALLLVWEFTGAWFESRGIMEFPTLSRLIVAVVPLPILEPLTVLVAAWLCWHWIVTKRREPTTLIRKEEKGGTDKWVWTTVTTDNGFSYLSARQAQAPQGAERFNVKEFKFRLPVLVGIILSIVLSYFFPAAQIIGAKAFDLPAFLGMPVGDALAFLVSAGVLGVLVALILGYLKVDPAKIPYIVNIVVAVIGAALTAGLKFVPPEVLGLTVWQALLAIFALFSGLAGARVSGLWQAAQFVRINGNPNAGGALAIAGER